jgi:hypothetical protein
MPPTAQSPPTRSDRALTAMKKEPDLAFLKGVSSVPLQQVLPVRAGILASQGRE